MTTEVDENGKTVSAYKMNSPSQEGRWERSKEDPDNAKMKTYKDGSIGWVYNLVKTDPDTGKKSDCWAAYNPYTHSSNSVLNDQFSIAYRRNNLTVYECHIPVSEITDPYRA